MTMKMKSTIYLILLYFCVNNNDILFRMNTEIHLGGGGSADEFWEVSISS